MNAATAAATYMATRGMVSLLEDPGMVVSAGWAAWKMRQR
jgi:hypothetical protein